MKEVHENRVDLISRINCTCSLDHVGVKVTHTKV